MAVSDIDESAAGTGAEKPVVVGVDRSDGARAALDFAFREAELRGAPLHVVYVWTISSKWAEGFNREWPQDRAYFSDLARKEATQMVEEHLAGRPWPPWLHVIVREGYAPVALLEAAKRAQMLVVGSRGRGGFASLLLGSVSTACVHHAECPVVVVRPPRKPAEHQPGKGDPSGP